MGDKYSYIFVAHAVILRVKRSLKNERNADNKRKRNEKTRESEKEIKQIFKKKIRNKRKFE